MALESKAALEQDTLNIVQGLIQINHDSRDGLHKAADHTDVPAVESLFRSMALQRALHAEQLDRLASANGETPRESGSMAASAHRAWIDLRSAMGGGTQAMLSEAVRGEEVIKQAYEEALKACPGSAVTDLLNHQFAEVKAAHDKVRELRDSYKR